MRTTANLAKPFPHRLAEPANEPPERLEEPVEEVPYGLGGLLAKPVKDSGLARADDADRLKDDKQREQSAN